MYVAKFLKKNRYKILTNLLSFHLQRPIDEIEKWTKNPNFWMRRAALVYTLPFAKPGRDPERSLSWASGYASDPEWFIQKAIGWWLRVLGEHNPERVILFLNAHWPQLKGVARKEAARKLSPGSPNVVLDFQYRGLNSLGSI
jgi:3-methyladenine DNA glycosylase AlkD